MATYSELVDQIRDWSNRDSSALSDAVIQDCLKYADDQAQIKLRIPPLQKYADFDSASLADALVEDKGYTHSQLYVPDDFLEFVSLVVYSDEDAIQYDIEQYVDYKVFWDYNIEVNGTSGIWTLYNNILYFSPGIKTDSSGTYSARLSYYGYLDALDATNPETADDITGYATQYTISGGTPPEETYYTVSSTSTTNSTELVKAVYVLTADTTQAVNKYYAAGTAVADLVAYSSLTTPTTVETVYITGLNTTNWLRDTNERILLYGALYYVFVYLNEPESAQRYMMLFEQEIKTQTDKYNKMIYSGPTLIQYTANGLI